MATEDRLEQLRSEALRHGVVNAVGVAPPGAPFPQATAGNGYYGLPLLKRPTWTWEVPTYFFVGGAAGAAAVVAAVASHTRPAGDDGAGGELARDAKWIAAVGGAVSGGLLTMDLGRPARFLNMLRVFKLQSPMSVGAWTLTAFSSAASASAFADLVKRRTGGALPVTIVGNAAEVLAGATGLGMATYTGVLIGTTAVPAWNRHVRMLPVHFAASGLASAVAILELLGHEDDALNRLGLAAAAIEVGTGAWLELDRGHASDPLKRGVSGWITRAGGVLSGPVPLALRLWTVSRGAKALSKRAQTIDEGRGSVARARDSGVGTEDPAVDERRRALTSAGHDRARNIRRVTAAITIAGALCTRIGWWLAGSRSADDPTVPMQLDRASSGARQRERS